MIPNLDPEIAAAIAERQPPPEHLVQIPIGDVASRRRIHETALAQTDTSTASGVFVRDFTVESSDGSSFLCRWYNPSTRNQDASTAAVIYFHGGGFILGNVALFEGVCSSYAANTNVPFLSVEYRLAPEHPFPKALEDAYAALCWLHHESRNLKVDAARIAVMGDSAGGGLAAALTHFCADKNGPKIAKQILIYPMLDDRTETCSDPAMISALTWTPSDNTTAWNALLGPVSARSPRLPPWAVPARMSMSEAKVLPPAYIEIAELDIFHKENMKYAAQLSRAGVSTEVHLRARCPHGWEHLAPQAKITTLATRDRRNCIQAL